MLQGHRAPDFLAESAAERRFEASLEEGLAAVAAEEQWEGLERCQLQAERGRVLVC